MTAIRDIRQHLGLTQDELAKLLGCTQGNVGHYERGQTVPPGVGGRLIQVCAERGLAIDFNHVYGGVPLPAAPPCIGVASQVAHAPQHQEPRHAA